MMFSWLLLLLGGAGLVAWLSRRDRQSESSLGAGTSGRSDLNILRERYARGEISKEQYEQMRRDLLE